MAIIKCKMCGGDLDLVEGASTAACEYCGSVQTVPKADDEKKLTLFARANRLRAACDFDKAAGIYESIVADFPGEAEAYWGLVLCKYGIEYVDDPGTGKKIPTCHRSSYDSVLADPDLEQAMENADVVAQGLYHQEAKEFERIRKGILEVSSNEQPYDIFICYKETDPQGDRTLDSVLAQDLYSALTEKGYRVFFSRITLQGKLGEAYEPYIFAALNSAKVMLAIGTCYEYYNAVWVKNEWSRYLKICAADKSKHLIPCYKDLAPEDMPQEFNHLQGANLGKMGAIQDILFNMEKYIPLKKEAPAAAQPVAAPAANNPTMESYLKRAFIFLEDGDWDSANEYCEKVLDIDPENARAYLAKLMVQLEVRHQEDLQYEGDALVDSSNYQKAVRYADSALRQQLESYVAAALAQREAERLEQERRAEEARLLREQQEAEARRAMEEKKRQMEAYFAAQKVVQNMISAGGYHSVAMNVDGTAVAVGLKADGRCDLGSWRDLVAVSAGSFHSLGLKADGTVLASKKQFLNQCDVEDWRDIVAISAGGSFSVGLRRDGTVAFTGSNVDGAQQIADWQNIVALAAGNNHVVGVRKDGSVLAVGKNDQGQCEVSAWQDIISADASESHTVGLKADGTVVAVGKNDQGQCDVGAWQDIVAVGAANAYTLGLKRDGSVVLAGKSMPVRSWQNVVAISVGKDHAIGVKADGKMVATDNVSACAVFDWKLFDNFKNLEQERVAAQEKRKALDAKMQVWRNAGKCQYCGGELKGMFTKKCASCGKTKDY